MTSNKLIPRKILFSNPDKTNVQISKDGTYVSYLAPYQGVLNIFVADSDNVNSSKVMTNDTKRGIREYFWSYDNKHIIYFKDNEGDENYYLHLINIDGFTDHAIKTNKDVKTKIIKTSRKHPNEIIIALNERRKDLFDLYKLNISNRKKELIYQNDKFMSFDLDDDYNIIFSYLMNDNGGVEIFHKGSKASYIHIQHKDVKTTNIVGFNKENDKAYFIDSRHRDKASLFMLDIAKKEQRLLFAPSDADINDIIIHPENKSLQAIGVNYKRNHYYTSLDNKPLDKNFKKDYELLKEKFTDGDVHISSKTLKDDKWIVLVEYDYKPVEYYMFTRDSAELKFLFNNREALTNYKLNKMKPIVIKTRDGLELVSYLTRPTANNDPVPMVLYVHGGPNARDSWGYDPVHQWLSNRGYAVLSVNYRGSTGFGKHFINSGDGQWAEKMHYDLIDAVNWAISEGIAQKDKIAIMGGSYGGYATLVGLTFTPDVFACGVDIVGPSNLLTLAKSIPEYWKPFIKDLIIKIGGDPDTKEGEKILKEKSPLFFVDRITKPLLIGQGANDPRVKQAESDQIVKLMKEKNIPVIYTLYPDEGHGFQRPENKLSFFAITEGFLSKSLGGQYEAITDDLSGSSIKIVEGEQHLPYQLDKQAV